MVTQTGNTHIAVIWAKDIHNGLLWHTSGSGKANEVFYAPFWSWASLEALLGFLKHDYGIY
jgi:hypothetical protein